MEPGDRAFPEGRQTRPTLDLVRRAQGGGQAALERLAARYLARLKRAARWRARSGTPAGGRP